MVREKKIEIGGKIIQGIEIELPSANLVLAIGKQGYIMCGYLNLETAEKFNQVAAIVKGVSCVEELLKVNLVAVSKKAQGLGLKTGMSAKEALKILA